MTTNFGHEDEAGRALPAAGGVGDVADGSVLAPKTLLQQLHQVQEELERYYLKCLDLDAERQLACVARDDARREIEVLRLQLQHLRNAVVEAGKPREPVSPLRSLVARVRLRRGSVESGRERERRHRIESLRECGWFDADWYLATYPDVRLAGMDPVAHYDEFGWKEARNPGPRFDTAWYLQANPDVAAAGANPLWHFVEHGRGEGRAARAP